MRLAHLSSCYLLKSFFFLLEIFIGILVAHNHAVASGKFLCFPQLSLLLVKMETGKDTHLMKFLKGLNKVCE